MINAQESALSLSKVEDQIYGVQVGTFGVWGFYEKGLTNTLSLRAELGLEAYYINFGQGFKIPNEYYSFQEDYAILPTINAELRWYYNFKKRHLKKRDISANNGNFLAFKLGYSPPFFAITSSPNPAGTINQLAFIPKWGIRRSITDHLDFELGLGLGYRFEFFDQEVFVDKTETDSHYYLYNMLDKSEFVIDFHLRLGYTF